MYHRFSFWDPVKYLILSGKSQYFYNDIKHKSSDTDSIANISEGKSWHLSKCQYSKALYSYQNFWYPTCMARSGQQYKDKYFIMNSKLSHTMWSFKSDGIQHVIDNPNIQLSFHYWRLCECLYYGRPYAGCLFPTFQLRFHWPCSWHADIHPLTSWYTVKSLI